MVWTWVTVWCPLFLSEGLFAVFPVVTSSPGFNRECLHLPGSCIKNALIFPSFVKGFSAGHKILCWLAFSFSSLIMSSPYFSVSTGSREKSTKFLAFTIIKGNLVFKDTMLLEEGIEIKNIKMVKKSPFLNWDSVILEKKSSPEYKPVVSYFPDNLKNVDFVKIFQHLL